jgi:hypothetical protein
MLPYEEGFTSISGGGYGPIGGQAVPLPIAFSYDESIPISTFGANPSLDFQLFQIPNFGELFANEFNASTRFNAATPTAYVDYSLNQLLSLLQPQSYPQGLFTPLQFQQQSIQDRFNRVLRNDPQTELQKAEAEAQRNKTLFEQAKEQYRKTEEALRKATKSNEILCNDCTPEQLEALKKTGKVPSESEKLFGIPGFKLTREMGYLFIAFVILILLLLFARK